MQALILAAGLGSRLDGAEDGLPKGLIKVGGKALLERQVEQLRARGIERICIVTGYRPELIERRFEAGVEFRHNPFFACSNNLVSVLLARDWIDEALLVAYADLLYEPEVLEAALDGGGDIRLVVDRAAVEAGHALVQLGDGEVRAMGRQVAPDDADARFVGLACFTPAGLGHFLPELERATRAGRIDQYYTVALSALADRGYPLRAVDVTGRRWCEIDSLDDLERARRAWG